MELIYNGMIISDTTTLVNNNICDRRFNCMEMSHPTQNISGWDNRDCVKPIYLTSEETYPSIDEVGNLIYQTKRNANGALPENTYKIVATDVSGSSKTISATGTIPHLEVQRLSGVGGVQIVGRIQLTEDSVSVA